MRVRRVGRVGREKKNVRWRTGEGVKDKERTWGDIFFSLHLHFWSSSSTLAWSRGTRFTTTQGNSFSGVFGRMWVTLFFQLTRDI